MNFSKILDRFRELKEQRNRSFELTEGVDDKQLTSLRNMRQKQLNEIEKRQLHQEIKQYNKQEFHHNMYGNNLLKEKHKLLDNVARSNSLLHDSRPLLKEKYKKVKIKFV